MNTSPDPADTTRHRLRFNAAAEAFETFPEMREDMLARPGDEDSLAFVDRLSDGLTPEEAITFASYLLPPREAVWWAHQCLSYVPDAMSANDRTMLDLAESWVREPGEETRRNAMDVAMDADPKTPAVWVALAAGWTGGSLAPADSAPVPPPPVLTPRAVNAAILSLLARVDRNGRSNMLKAFVGMAVKLTEAP